MQERAACLKHSDFFKVNDPSPPTAQLRAAESSERKDARRQCIPIGRPAHTPRNPTTSVLTATTLIYAIGAGITAAAGTRLALQLILDMRFKWFSFQLPEQDALALLFIVTTSLYQDWVIYAPAAFLGCGSRFSGSLSGVKP